MSKNPLFAQKYPPEGAQIKVFRKCQGTVYSRAASELAHTTMLAHPAISLFRSPPHQCPPTSRGALSSELETSPTAGLGGAETVYAGFADFEARAGKPAPAYAGPV